jgi:hypothetical protein
MAVMETGLCSFKETAVEMPDARIVCPKCQHEMTPGWVEHMIPFLTLGSGLTSKDLYFRSDSGGVHCIMRSNQKKQAFRCEACSSVLITEASH